MNAPTSDNDSRRCSNIVLLLHRSQSFQAEKASQKSCEKKKKINVRAWTISCKKHLTQGITGDLGQAAETASHLSDLHVMRHLGELSTPVNVNWNPI